MAQRKSSRRGTRAFLILLAVVIIGGVLLGSTGNLRNPLESTLMLAQVSGSEPGFRMAGDEAIAATSDTATSAAAASEAETTTDTETQVAAEAADTATVVQMTADELVAALEAAGVDVATVTANLEAEGRGIDNLLAVVNSGRVTVDDLAARLQTTSSDGQEAASALPERAGGETSASLLDIQWSAVASVLYNLWLMLAMTVVVIVLARPLGWVVQRINQRPATRHSNSLA